MLWRTRERYISIFSASFSAPGIGITPTGAVHAAHATALRLRRALCVQRNVGVMVRMGGRALKSDIKALLSEPASHRVATSTDSLSSQNQNRKCISGGRINSDNPNRGPSRECANRIECANQGEYANQSECANAMRWRRLDYCS